MGSSQYGACRRFLGILAAVMAAATATAQVPPGYTIESFRDEFDGTSLDATKWNAGVINYPSGSTWLWRNHPGNNAVAGGFLIQTTLYQDVTGDGVPEWTCSSVAARSFSQRFGYWESRLRITDFNWTDNAWWSSDIGTGRLSGMDGFEIDAPEAWSPNRYTASVYDHAVQDGSTPSSIHFAQNMPGKNFTENFSVFAWDWGTDNSVRCFVDGVLVHTFSAAAMNSIEALVPQGPIQGTALWTTGLTPANQIADGDSKLVDYVRIYQKPGWSGTGAVKRWGDAANWGPDGVPASGRAAVFNTAAASGTITLAADQPVQEIVFQGGDTGTTTIAGPGRLLLGMTTAVTATTGAVGGINLVNDTTAGVTVAAEIVAQRKLQFSNFAGASITPGPTPGVDLVLAGRLSAADAGTPVNFLTTAPIVVTGTIDGSVGRITKGGQGIVRLNAANAFVGGLEIRDGIVEVNADGALGAVGGGVTLVPGSAYDQPSLVLNAVAYSDPVPIAIQGGGTRTANYPQSSGALESSGTSRFAGPITASDDATIFVQRNGHLTLSGTVDTRDHVLTLGSLGTLVVSGRVTGSSGGQLDKFNSGTTVLNGDNTGFLGSVQVRLGTLSVNGDNALGGGTGDVVRLAGGALQATADFTSAKGGSFAPSAGNAIHTNGRSVAFNGGFSGPGGFIKQGAGTLTFGGSNSFQGLVRIQTGTLAAAHPAALAGATLDLAAADAGVLRLAVAGTTSYLLGGLQGSRDLVLGGNSVSVGHNGTSTSFSGRILGTGGFSKVGGGILTLAGSNTYSGTTEVLAGVLSIGSTAALPGWSTPGRFMVADGATLAVSNAISDAALLAIVQTGNLRDAASIGFDTSAGPRTYATDLGSLGRTFGLTKVGGSTLVIEANNTFLGPTTVIGGTLQIGTGGTTGSLASPSVAVAAGGVITFNRSDDVAFPGSIHGAGGLVKVGSGTLALAADQLFSGRTVVQAGTLQIGTGGTTGALATSEIDVAAAATVLIHRRDNLRLSASIIGPGSFLKLGTGTVELAGTNSFTGTARISSGVLSLTSTAALAGATLDLAAADSGTVAFGVVGPTTYHLGGLQGTRGLALGGNSLMVGSNGTTTTYGGVLSGTGRLTKVGGGTLTLGGTNVHTGGITILGGAVSVSAEGRLGAAGGGLRLDGGALQSTAGMTLAAARAVSIGPGGGMLDHTGGSNLIVGGSVAGGDAVLTVRTSSPILGAVFLDGAVTLGGLTLTGSTSGAGLRSSAVIGGPIRVGERQVLHLNGLNGTGTASATYAGFEVALAGGMLRNRFGGNVLTRSISVTAASTVENRSGNGNSLTFGAGTLALGTNTLTVQCGPAPGEWVEIAGGVSGADASGLTVTGGGQLRLSGSNPGFSGRVTIANGEVRLDSPTAVNAQVSIGFSGTSPARKLTLNAPDADIGRLDLADGVRVEIGDGLMSVRNGLSTSRLLEALVEGRGSGLWNAPAGITSSAVATAAIAAVTRTIGWIERDGGGVSFGLTAPGDTNLDGVVDLLDAANLIAGGGFDTGFAATWMQGDFDYDGVVDILDVAGFMSGGLFDSGPFMAAPAAVERVAAVPEPGLPASILLAMLLASVGLSRRTGGACWRRFSRRLLQANRGRGLALDGARPAVCCRASGGC